MSNKLIPKLIRAGYYSLILLFTFTISLGVFTFTDWAWMYPYEGDFYIYVPLDYETNRSINPERGMYYYTVQANNYTMKLYPYHRFECDGVSNPERLNNYAGCYVKMTLKWGNYDDENWYIRTITNVEYQDGQYLGDYPRGVGYGPYYHAEKDDISWGLNIIFAGIITGALGVMPIWLDWDSRKEKKVKDNGKHQ